MHQSVKDKDPKKSDSPHFRFIIVNSTVLITACLVQPLNLLKTRIQLDGFEAPKIGCSNSLTCMLGILKTEGFLTFYKGISAAILRQICYTSGRLFVYASLNKEFKRTYHKEPSIFVRMGMATVAGALGAFVSTPGEIALVRMTADGQLPVRMQRNYKNVVHSLVRISKEEGTRVIWRGGCSTVVRAMVVNMAQLPTYSGSKTYIKKNYKLREGLPLHCCAALVSSICTTFASMPIDMVKTRKQNMNMKGLKREVSAFEILSNLIKKEGFLALWKGHAPNNLRLFALNVIIYVILDGIIPFN